MVIARSLWEASLTTCGTFLIFPPNKTPILSFLLPATLRGTQANIARGQSTPEKSDEVNVLKSKLAGMWIRTTLSGQDSNTLRTLVWWRLCIVFSLCLKYLGFFKVIWVKIASLHSCQILVHTVPFKVLIPWHLLSRLGIMASEKKQPTGESQTMNYEHGPTKEKRPWLLLMKNCCTKIKQQQTNKDKHIEEENFYEIRV